MIKRIVELDAKLIDLAQDGYLWMFDRTGIYLGTCQALLLLAAQPFLPKQDAFSIGFAAIIMLSLAWRYHLQQRAMYAVANAIARSFRDTPWRWPFIVFMLTVAALPPYDWHAVAAILELLNLTYLSCVQIRERQPKDLFAGWRTPAFAGGAA